MGDSNYLVNTWTLSVKDVNLYKMPSITFLKISVLNSNSYHLINIRDKNVVLKNLKV